MEAKPEEYGIILEVRKCFTAKCFWLKFVLGSC